MVMLALLSSTSRARVVAVIAPPLTVKAPGPATLVSRMPLTALAALVTVLNVKPAAPMVTPLRLTPVPVKLVIWLVALVAVIVPPPVATNAVIAAPLPARLIAPVKSIVAPVLLVRVTAALAPVPVTVAAERDGAAGAVGDVDGVAGVAGDRRRRR